MKRSHALEYYRPIPSLSLLYEKVKKLEEGANLLEKKWKRKLKWGWGKEKSKEKTLAV